MSNKVVIGGAISVTEQDVIDSRVTAADAVAELTMIRRRIRTFYAAIIQVTFPVEAPSWAEQWDSWLLTGEVLSASEAETPPA